MKNFLYTSEILIVIFILFFFSSCNNTKDIAAIVNGEIITKSSVSAAYRQQEPNIQNPYVKLQSESEILHNTIKQLVVIQYGKKKGIDITDEQLNRHINELKSSALTAYEKGIKYYGEQAYIEGLKQQLYYNESQQLILSELNSAKPSSYTDKEIQEYLSDFEIEISEFTDEEKKQIVAMMKNERLEKEFDEFVLNLMEESEIRVLMED